MARPRKSKKSRNIILLLLLLAGGGGFAIWKKKQGEEKPIEVTTEKVKRRDITESVVATGQIHPVTKVVINPEVAGEIVKLPVREGQSVKEGELLVKIKADEYVASRELAEASYQSSLANLKLSQANLNKAKADFERTADLHKNKLISDAEFLSAKTAHEVSQASTESAGHGVSQAKASLDRADENLAKTSILAPMDGTIIQLRSEKGERVVGTSLMAGTEIMTVARLDNMEARVEVGEIDVVNIKVGQKARIEVDAFRNDEFAGEVTEIANASNTAQMSNLGSMSSGSQQATKFQVKIQVLAKEAFRPGMSVTAFIETQTESDVLSVPLQAVTTRGKKKEDKNSNKDDDESEGGPPLRKKKSRAEVEELVFLREGDRVKSVVVERGISDDDYVEITSGLKESQEVVTGNYRAINRDLKDDALIEATAKSNAEDERQAEDES